MARRGLWVVVVLGGLGILGCSSEVASGLDEHDAQEVLATLYQAGIPAEKESSGDAHRYRVEVANGDAGRAASILRGHGLPRAPKQGFASLYGSASMIPTPTEEKARFLEALGAELGAHLERLPGVLDASVLVTAPADDPLAATGATRTPSTASVLLRTRPGQVPPAEADVQRLVAGAVEGLTPASVSVVTVASPATPDDGAPFASVGPIQVARASRGALLGVLGGALAVIALLGVWLVAGERRLARLRERVITGR